MTTPAAADLYLAQHRYANEGKRYALYNPNNRLLDELPVIYGFNSSGSTGWLSAVAIAEDGEVLGGHCCSHEGYMEADLGILEGTRPDRHEGSYKKHYPNGYRMDFIPYDKVTGHEGLNKALQLNKEKEHDRTSDTEHLPGED